MKMMKFTSSSESLKLSMFPSVWFQKCVTSLILWRNWLISIRGTICCWWNVVKLDLNSERKDTKHSSSNCRCWYISFIIIFHQFHITCIIFHICFRRHIRRLFCISALISCLIGKKDCLFDYRGRDSLSQWRDMKFNQQLNNTKKLVRIVRNTISASSSQCFTHFCGSRVLNSTQTSKQSILNTC